MNLLPGISSLKRLALALLCCAILAPAASATWSIVVVNRKTGEVCVASATCLGNKFPLKKWLPVIVVEQGAAAAQSMIDSLGGNRMLIWNKIHGGVVPARILDLLDKQDGFHQSRQYGIVTFDGDPVSFTGSNAGLARFGVTGEVDDLVYAIQGNVLAGNEVIIETEKTLRSAGGDLGQRVMAAMETARLWGGDGRCSCDPVDADGCGSPPPSFTHSAYTAFIVLARPGDTDGVCNKDEGCASGDYYLAKVFKGQGPGDPDPVLELQIRYDDWRQNKLGKPDHYLSKVEVDRESVVADGLCSAHVHVRLRDVDGVPLTGGGHEITVEQVSPGPDTAIASPVTDNGDGTYDFDMISTLQAGQGEFQVSARYGPNAVVLLRPLLALETSPLAELHAGNSTLSAGGGGGVPFTVNRGAADAGRPYRLLGTYSGTIPGFDYQGVHVPLNRDRFFWFTWNTPGNSPGFGSSAGVLDSNGRAQALLTIDGGLWSGLIGQRFDLCGLLFGAPPEVTNLVGFEVIL